MRHHPFILVVLIGTLSIDCRLLAQEPTLRDTLVPEDASDQPVGQAICKVGVFSPDGTWLATNAAPGTRHGTRLWNLTNGKSKLIGRIGAAPERFSENGTLLIHVPILTQDKREVEIYDLSKDQATAVSSQDGEILDDLSPDGATVVVHDRKSAYTMIRLATPFDSSTVASRVPLTGSQFNVGHGLTRAMFSPDGGTLAVPEKGGNVMLWNVATGKHKSLTDSHARWFVFSPQGKTLLAQQKSDPRKGIAPPKIQNEYPLALFNVTSGKKLTTLIFAANDTPESFQFSPDGKTLATLGKQSLHHCRRRNRRCWR